MDLKIGDAEASANPNPYTSWSERLAGLRGKSDAATTLRPVFVRSRDPGIKTADFFKTLTDSPDLADVSFDQMERKLNSDDLRQDGPIEAVLYVPQSWQLAATPTVPVAALLDLVEIVETGAGVDVSGEGDAPAERRLRLPECPDHGLVAGVIDDGLGFLNARFRNGGTTRFAALWIQTLAQRTARAQGVALGHVLDNRAINNRLADLGTGSETAVYKQLRNDIPALRHGFAPGTERTVERRASHGTHVLDTFAGADPVAPGSDETVRSVPILGVQLPAQSVDDTSGVRLDLHIIQGVRWMILQAQQMKATRLVLNVSYGVNAGPKDGARFIETQLEREVDRAARAGIELTLVLPFGNEYLDRTLATLAVGRHKAASIDLRLARDDQTASFVEIHCPDHAALPPDLELGVIAPSGARSERVSIAPGHESPIQLDQKEVGRLFHTQGLNGASRLILAFSPSSQPLENAQGKGDVDLVHSGRWQIVLKRNRGPALSVVLQVQRDTSAFGYRHAGRQAIFDDEAAHWPSVRFRDFSDLHPSAPVSHKGTNSAYVSRRYPGFHAIGAARIPDGLDAATSLFPAYYTSEGADWSGGPPTSSALVETSGIQSGRLGAGVVSGSRLRLSGTSIAAALAARALLFDALGLPGFSLTPVPGDSTRHSRLGDLVYSD